MTNRRLWSFGALLAVAALATTAMTVDAEEIGIHFVGPDDFDIVVAGNRDPGWTPTSTDWAQGKPRAYTISLTDDGTPPVIGPGGAMTLRVAARNASGELPARVRLTIADPDDNSGDLDPATGRPVDLFDQLHFTVRDGTTVLLADVEGSGVTGSTYDWPVPWGPGEVRVLDVTIALPVTLGNEWEDATSAVQFSFEANSD